MSFPVTHQKRILAPTWAIRLVAETDVGSIASVRLLVCCVTEGPRYNCDLRLRNFVEYEGHLLWTASDLVIRSYTPLLFVEIMTGLSEMLSDLTVTSNSLIFVLLPRTSPTVTTNRSPQLSHGHHLSYGIKFDRDDLRTSARGGTWAAQ